MAHLTNMTIKAYNAKDAIKIAAHFVDNYNTTCEGKYVTIQIAHIEIVDTLTDLRDARFDYDDVSY